MRRGDVVYLALTEARCTPSGYCHRKGMCARHLVKPDQGRPVSRLWVLTCLAWTIKTW